MIIGFLKNILRVTVEKILPSKSIIETMPVKKSFLKDVLDQPQYLREAIKNYSFNEIDLLSQKIASGNIKRIILTGHGSSFNSLYPAYLKLCANFLPVMLWQTAELVHYGFNQVDSGTLLCVNSQSGRSAEIVHLVEKISEKRPGYLLALTNAPSSTLGSSADGILQLHAGEEHGVAVKTYMNALCLSSLFAAQLCGANMEAACGSMLAACDAMETYLDDWETKSREIETIYGDIKRTVIVGRGPSLASAMNAALNQKEAAWLFTEGMSAAEFRHGPLELADGNLKLIVLEGDRMTSRFNAALAEDVKKYGGEIIWIGNNPPEKYQKIDFPKVDDIARPLVELLPLQLLANQLAQRQNIEAGKFRFIGKVVMKE